jgi:hypothetical protein
MCLGNAVHLKKKFGDGYRLSLSYGKISFKNNFPDVEYEEKIFAFIKRLVPESRLINQFYGISVFNIPNENSKISFLFSEIEKNKTEQNIKNWGLSQTSLEDVFLEVIKNDESTDE